MDAPTSGFRLWLSRLRRALGAFFGSRPAHLMALFALAVAQPLFDLLAKTPQFFAVRSLTAIDIWLFVGLMFLGIPLTLAALARLGGLFANSLENAIYAVWLALSGALLGQQLLKRLSALPDVAQPILALTLGALFAFAYVRRDELRQLLAILAPMTLAVPLLFVGALPSQLLGTRAATVAKSHAIDNPVPVVMVLFDELPITSLLDAEERVDARLFPSFARLAAQSTWFRHATAVASLTENAVPAILTGTYPREPRLPTLEDHPRNLFTLLGETYDLRVFEPRTQLCPHCPPFGSRPSAGGRRQRLMVDLGVIYLHLLLPEAWTGHLPPITADWQSFGRLEDKGRDVRELIAAIEPVEQPTLYFLHALLPHYPWIYLPSGKRYDPGRGHLDGLDDRTGRWINDEWAVVQAWQRHLLQLRFADRLLGTLLDRLEETGLFDRALLIVLADHGISFQSDGSSRLATPQTYHDVMAVPLFVKLPGQREGTIERNSVEVVDVLPTVAEVLDIDIEAALFDGRSLFSEDPERERKWIFNSREDHQWVQDPTMAGQLETLRRKTAFFGSVADPSALFRMGPFRDQLYGRPLADLTLSAPGEILAELDRGERLAEVDLRQEVLPVRVTGHLRSMPPGQRFPLALAVNGTVEALTLTRIESGWHGHFSFMVAEAALRQGRNEVALFRVQPTAKGPVLEPVRLVGSAGLTLERDDQGAVVGLVSPAGKSFALVSDRFAGQTLGVWVGDHRVEVVGRAWDKTRARAADWVAIFVDGRLLHSSSPNLTSSSLLSRYALPDLDRGGFAWFLESEEMEGEVRVFAGSDDGAAGELEFVKRLDRGSLVGGQ